MSTPLRSTCSSERINRSLSARTRSDDHPIMLDGSGPRPCHLPPVLGRTLHSARPGRAVAQYRRSGAGRPVQQAAHNAITNRVRFAGRQRDYRAFGKGRTVAGSGSKVAGCRLNAGAVLCSSVRFDNTTICDRIVGHGMDESWARCDELAPAIANGFDLGGCSAKLVEDH